MKSLNNQIIWNFTGKPAKLQDVIDCCGKGWNDVIASLVSDLFELGWDGQLFQAKEKFGGLRFYIAQGNEAIWERISRAENESQSTCIECGEPAKVYYDGWMLPLCEKHAKENGRTDTGIPTT